MAYLAVAASTPLDDNNTNHSLRATGASSLFTASVLEKIIQQRSVHSSLEGL